MDNKIVAVDDDLVLVSAVEFLWRVLVLFENETVGVGGCDSEAEIVERLAIGISDERAELAGLPDSRPVVIGTVVAVFSGAPPSPLQIYPPIPPPPLSTLIGLIGS